MNMKRNFAIVASMLSFWTTRAHAHPGHGTTAPTSVEHYVLEPEHAVSGLFVLAIIAATAVVIWRRRSLKRVASQRQDQTSR